MGLTLSPANGKVVQTVVGRVVNGVKFSDILDVWLFQYDGQVNLDNATTKEVAQAKWMTKAQIRELICAGQFVPSLEYILTEEAL